jgi:uncharacterized membrane protein YbhN (UPF0104 family)
LIDAVRMYRERIGAVVISTVISIGVHLCSVGCYYLLGKSIPGLGPTLAEHCVIVPLAMVIGAIPLTPAGAGTLEAAVEEMFRVLPSETIAPGRGLLVSLGYRIITIAIAMVGVVIYFFCRREVAAALHDTAASADPAEAEAAEPTAG